MGFSLSNAVAQICSNPPVILRHPETQAVLRTSNATFTVVAEAVAPTLGYPFAYQWQINSHLGMSNFVDIAGATNHMLTITGATTNDVAFYRVAVSGGGITISEPAALLVAWTNSPFTVSGPIAYAGGSMPACPGPYSGYVRYLLTCKSWWGFPTAGTSHTATDPQRSDTKVEFTGKYWDSGCNSNSVIVPHPTTSAQYRFAIYFPPPPAPGPPISPSTYNIVLDGFTFVSCPPIGSE